MFKQTDIRYGDVVKYSWFVGILGQSESINGRILGKIKPSKTYAAGFDSSFYYVLKPDKDTREELLDSEEIMRTFFIALDNTDLEWGSLPPHPFITVPQEGISSAFGPNYEADFKKKGLCPRCGWYGQWVNGGLVCKYHGLYL